MKKLFTFLFCTIFIYVKGRAQFTENFETFPVTQFSVSAGYTATKSAYFEQGASSVLFNTANTNAQGALTMKTDINLTALSNPKLSFYQICATEGGADYGYVQYSTDGGTTWTTFPVTAYKGQGILKNSVVSFDDSSYTDWAAQFTATSSTPWNGSGGAFWKQEVIDLKSFANSTNFRVRFTYTTNGANNYYGWLIDRVAIVSATALSGNAYTIDNTLATGANNYNNFRDAITDLNVKGVSSAVTFNVIAGQTFAEDAPAIFASGTASNTINFIKSGSNANPVIKPTGGDSSTMDAGITIWGGDYITFDGIDIAESTGNAAEYGYYIASASATNGAQNNTIKNTSITLSRDNTNSFGIYQWAKYNPSNGTSNTNNNNKYYNLTIKNAFGGVYLKGWSSSNPDLNCEVGNTISSTSFNTIGNPKFPNDIGGGAENVYGVGIRATYQSGVKIYNNEVSNVFTSSSNSNAIGIFLETSTGNSLAYNNKVHDITTNSTAASSPATVIGIRADVSSNNTATVYNNFVYSLSHSISNIKTKITTPVMIGIAANVGNTKGTANVYHNSVSLAATNTNAICAALYTTKSGTSFIKNNIFSNTSTSTLATAKRYVIYRDSGTVTSDYNDLYVASGNNNFIGYYTTDQTTLANWKLATGKDASSRNENPPFVSATDLHIPNGTTTELESSGAATSITNITTDIDAQTRPGPAGSLNGGGNTPDIGADEFDGKPVPVMTYSSSGAIQTNASVCQGTQSVQIIGMQVVTANSALPLTLTNLVINPNGTTSLSNSVATFQIFYTGTSNTFNTNNPVNNATAVTTGNNTVAPNSTITLATGTNYFWLVYNLKSTVTGSLDAQFNSVTVTSGSTAATYTPTITDPTGFISVNPIPVATISAGTSPACEGTSIPVTITGTSGATVSYTLNGTAQTPVTLPTGSGNQSLIINSPTDAITYKYIITSISNAPASTCTGTTGAANQTVTVIVNPNPTVAAIMPAPETTGKSYVQVNNILQLSDAPPANATGAWSSSTTQTTVDNTGTVTAGTTAGTPIITYTVTDGNGCQNSATQAVRVYTPDYVNVTASNNFSDKNNWKINRGDNTYIPATAYPAGTNYTSITLTTPLNMDVDFQLPSGKTFTIATGGTLTILPNKTFSSLATLAGAVDFGNDSVTVKSNATGTGAIGFVASKILNASKVTAERYIGSTVAASGKRAWRLITAPVTNTTINGAWQEGQVKNTSSPTVGSTTYGTLITGASQGSAATAFNNGFDFWTAIAGNATSSIRFYNPGTNTWISPSTIKNVDVGSQPAYMLFVRGNRSVQSAGYPYSITTLRATGTLNQGSVQTNIDQTKPYAVAGNPFASTIDFDQVYGANSGLIQQKFAIWRANQGTYGAYSLVYKNGGTYAIVPNALTGTGTDADTVRYIQSGEGFMVYPVSGSNTAAKLIISESAKASSHQANGIGSTFDVRPSTEAKLYVNVNLVNADSTTTLADGILARYDASYSAQIDEDDAAKQTNFNENLAIESNSTDLIVEARPDIQRKDTLQLKLWNVSLRSYQLQIKGDNFAQSVAQGLHAYLEDSYLKTREEVSLSGTIATASFTVTTDTASYNPHRFRIVFQSASSVLPVTITHIKAALQNGGVAVSWTTGNEATVKEYTVERSVDEGATFASLTAQAAKNAAGVAVASYGTFDAAPHRGDNLYRIRVEGEDGKLTYSEVAKVAVGEDGSSKRLITLYPNPVSRREGKATLVLKNVEKGEYLVSVYGGSGQTLVEKKVTVGANAGTQTETITLPSSMAQGGYELRLTSHAGNTLFLDKLIIGK